MTKGNEGVWIYTDKGEFKIPASEVKICDNIGVSDTVLAVAALERYLGTEENNIGLLLNHAANTVLRELGTKTINIEDFKLFRQRMVK